MESKAVVQLAQNVLMLIVIFLLFIGLIIFAFLWYKQQKRIQQLEKNIQEITERQEITLIQAELKGRDIERTRIAQDWHDGIGNSLASLRLIIEIILTQNSGKHATVLTLLEQVQQEFRYIIDNELVSDFKDKQAVLETLKRWQHQLQLGNIEFEFDVYNLCKYDKWDIQAKSHLFRIVQELVSNAIKYAKGTKFDLTLSERANFLQLTFDDNGAEWNKNEKHKSTITLKSIQKRLKLLDGQLSIDTTKNGGIFIRINIPLTR